MTQIAIVLVKPRSGSEIRYSGELLWRDERAIAIRASWGRPALDLGYITFGADDTFDEYFFSDRWYTIFALHGPDGALKGWYCNIARPAQLGHHTVVSEDLELDLWVAPDGAALRLDEDEFAAAGHTPEETAAAHAALAELEWMARAGELPHESAT